MVLEPDSEYRSSPSDEGRTSAPPGEHQGWVPAQRAEGAVEIKGTRKGLSVTLGAGDWPELLRELDDRLGKAAAFFEGSQVNLRTGRRELSQAEIEQVIQVLNSHRVELASLETASKAAGAAAQAMGIRLALPEVSYAPEVRVQAEEWSEGMLLRRTVRSGQSIRHPGHVVIVGDVNPGAEVIAGGDVVVWGKLCGMVQAGALGNSDAVVCALELRPTLLRIAGHIATSPKEKASGARQPEIASVVDDQIVARPWGSR
jgi:septum site-determining protein MinC